jgi:hypothetical protein
MGWKFWEKSSSVEPVGKSSKLPKPKDVPPVVGQYLVVTMGLDPDWVWRLKAVTRPQADSNSRRDIRIFDESAAIVRKVAVRDYNTLEDHPKLILYEGWFDKVSGAIKIEKNTDPTAPVRDAA